MRDDFWNCAVTDVNGRATPIYTKVDGVNYLAASGWKSYGIACDTIIWPKKD